MPLGSFRLNTLARRIVAAISRLAVSVTAVGDAKISTAQSKFGGASGLFDGTGDYLGISQYESFIFGTSTDFTIECWFRLNALNVTQIIWDQRTTLVGNFPSLYVASDNKLKYYTQGNPRIESGVLSTNTWYHGAVVRTGSDHKLYLNGVQVGSTYTNAIDYTSGPIKIGEISYSTGGNWNGHLDELRVSNSARYTSNFTAPTAPFTNDENTLLLLHMDGTDASTYFEDDNGVRAKKGITAVGNAQVDTAQSKFGGSSALFDGTGDYLFVYNNDNLAVGTGDYTVEYWVRPNSTAASVHFDTRRLSNSNDVGITLYYSGTALTLFQGGNIRITGSALNVGTWYHIALVRSGNDQKLYINGTQSGSTYTASVNIANAALQTTIATASDNANNLNFNGWIDEFRFSNTARYTSNFTAPTVPFVNDENTLLLLHMDGTDASTVFIDDNGVSPDWEY